MKRSIGHLEAAAGVAGLIKTALCLYHGCIPPGRAIETLNPAIDFSGLRLAEQGEAVPLQPNGCAGINSFGFGGTNAHAVLQAVAGESVERTDPMREGGASACFSKNGVCAECSGAGLAGCADEAGCSDAGCLVYGIGSPGASCLSGGVCRKNANGVAGPTGGLPASSRD